jgi:5-methyltetrahydrofolate--homocysteine methyltransferase
METVLRSASKDVVIGGGKIGSAFLPMAISAGLTSAIMDARSPELVRACKAADLLLNRDDWGANWIAAHRGQAQAQASA